MEGAGLAHCIIVSFYHMMAMGRATSWAGWGKERWTNVHRKEFQFCSFTFVQGFHILVNAATVLLQIEARREREEQISFPMTFMLKTRKQAEEHLFVKLQGRRWWSGRQYI